MEVAAFFNVVKHCKCSGTAVRFVWNWAWVEQPKNVVGQIKLFPTLLI